MPRRSIGSAAVLRSHGKLLWRVTRSDLRARYAGSVLGFGWVVLGPLLILAIYAVIYLEIFKLRVEGLSAAEYVLFIFCGLVPFLATAEALSLGVGSVIANKSVLSNTVFPIDLAPVGSVLMSQGTIVVGFGIVLVGGAAFGALEPTALLLPAVWLLHLLAVIGVVWVLALLNVLLRDLQTALTAILMVILVASPIAFTPDQVPEALRPLIVLNPFAYFVVSYQKVLILGEVPSAWQWLAMVAIAGVAFLGGSWFFARVKRVVLDHV